jgi:hypothetical protein
MTIESLRQDLDKWLVYSNTARPQPGYRNMGKNPRAAITRYKESNRSAEIEGSQGN